MQTAQRPRVISEKVKLGRLYERVSAAGNKSFVGRIGAARVLLFRDRDDEQCWNLFVRSLDGSRGVTQRTSGRQADWTKTATPQAGAPTCAHCQHQA